MPLTSAIQSAMAVRMEREKRHQRRLSKIRRESGAGAGQGSSIICTKRQSVASTATLEETPEAMVRPPPDKSESMVTTFHLGIVFILLGFIMILSSMIPSSIIKADWSRLLGVGVAFIFIGLIMVMVNRIITAREEEELSQYVKQRLSRTRSGQPFVRNSVCGNIVVPDIVKPNPGPPIPSAMKGGGGHPPRSPKDKVTFAEFTDVCVTKIDEVVREESDASVAETVIQVDNCNNTLEVPSSELLNTGGKVTVLETITECPRSSGSEPVSDILVVTQTDTEEAENDSPESDETMRLLQSSEQSSFPSPRAKNQTQK